jgi:polyprenyl-phospho-N-acetylgalactosaminyl synthase
MQNCAFSCRLGASPILKEMSDPTLWIVIPAFNESAVIGDVIGGLSAYLPHVVVVDDGSRDQTGSLAKAAGAALVTHSVNMGQGAALETGIAYALSQGAEIVCTFDADGQHPPAAVEALHRTLLRTQSDIVFGSRFLDGATRLPRTRRILLRLVVLLQKSQTGLFVTDAHNGLRMMRAHVAERMHFKHARMAHASEIMHITKKYNFSYAEVPTSISYTLYSLKKGQSLLSATDIAFDLFYDAWTR